MKLEVEVDGREYGVDIERRGGEFSVQLDGRPLSVDARALEGFFTSILVNGHAYEVTVEPEGEAWRVQVGIETHKVVFLDPLRSSRDDGGAARLDSSGGGAMGGGAGNQRSGGRSVVTSLMPGKIVRVLVKKGDEVQEGQSLLVVEAMKMENEVVSPIVGRVLDVKAAPGDAVEAGAPLVIVG